MQVPAPVMWTVFPATVQGPEAVKLTASPEVAVALTVKSASPTVLPARAPNVIVWDTFCALVNSSTSAGA